MADGLTDSEVRFLARARLMTTGAWAWAGYAAVACLMAVAVNCGLTALSFPNYAGLYYPEGASAENYYEIYYVNNIAKAEFFAILSAFSVLFILSNRKWLRITRSVIEGRVLTEKESRFVSKLNKPFPTWLVYLIYAGIVVCFDVCLYTLYGIIFMSDPLGPYKDIYREYRLWTVGRYFAYLACLVYSSYIPERYLDIINRLRDAADAPEAAAEAAETGQADQPDG